MINLELMLKEKEELKKVIQEKNNLEEQKREKERILENKFYTLKRELQNKEYKEKSEIVKNFTEDFLRLEKEIQEKVKIKKEYEKIMQIYEIKDCKVEELKNVYSRNYSEKVYHEAIDTIINNKYNSIKVYIVIDKDKPKNKYSLEIVGKSIFNDDIIGYTRGDRTFSVGSDLSGYFQLQLSVKNFDSEQKAFDYYMKNKNKIAEKEEIKKYIEIEKIIQEVEKIDRKYFLEYKKEWFENCYSNYEKEKKYQDILKELTEV